MPKFSIVIPCFNAEATLGETLKSIQAQSCQDWEAICVDDGSTDGTRKLIHDAAKKDGRIRGIHNLGKGPSAARNFGAAFFATGSIISFCDADDLWSASKLAEVDAHLNETGADATFGKIAFFENKVTDARVVSTVPDKPLTIDDLLGENPVCTMSNLSIRSESLHRFGWFDEKVVHNEDLEWLIRVVGQGGSIRGQQALQVWYRASPTGLSADISAMAAGRNAVLRTARQFGARPSRQSNAIHKRYLARRALRVGHDRTLALGLTLSGLLQSPCGFMTPPRRGTLTLLGAFANFLMPRSVARALFS